MNKKLYHLIDVRDGFKPMKNWAVFLDRDGVINEERHLVRKIKDFVIYSAVFKAIKLLNQHNIPTVVHYNASVVARGLCSVEQIVKLNEYMKKQLAKKGAFVDMILFCSHHPTAFNADMVHDCSWRKPNIGILKFAAKMFNFNLKKSYVVGDAARDILMAQKAGAMGILVKTGHGGKDKVYQARPEIVVKDILKAVEHIIEKKNL